MSPWTLLASRFPRNDRRLTVEGKEGTQRGGTQRGRDSKGGGTQRSRKRGQGSLIHPSPSFSSVDAANRLAHPCLHHHTMCNVPHNPKQDNSTPKSAPLPPPSAPPTEPAASPRSALQDNNPRLIVLLKPLPLLFGKLTDYSRRLIVLFKPLSPHRESSIVHCPSLPPYRGLLIVDCPAAYFPLSALPASESVGHC